jgi:hypothetical protein
VDELVADVPTTGEKAVKVDEWLARARALSMEAGRRGLSPQAAVATSTRAAVETPTRKSTDVRELLGERRAAELQDLVDRAARARGQYPEGRLQQDLQKVAKHGADAARVIATRQVLAQKPRERGTARTPAPNSLAAHADVLGPDAVQRISTRAEALAPGLSKPDDARSLTEKRRWLTDVRRSLGDPFKDLGALGKLRDTDPDRARAGLNEWWRENAEPAAKVVALERARAELLVEQEPSAAEVSAGM